MNFETTWQDKFSSALEKHAGCEIRDRVMIGSPSPESPVGSEDAIQWTALAMERMDQEVESKRSQEILLDCACQYPSERILPIASDFQSHGDIDLALDSLQKLFLSFLRDDLNLPNEVVDKVIERGWGLAGRRSGNTVIATKIPKSENLAAYFRESDPKKRRQLYCHCPRIRNAITLEIDISPIYCYCGGGFYRGIWERILGHEVQIKLLQSIIRGDEVCQFRVQLG